MGSKLYKHVFVMNIALRHMLTLNTLSKNFSRYLKTFLFSFCFPGTAFDIGDNLHGTSDLFSGKSRKNVMLNFPIER